MPPALVRFTSVRVLITGTAAIIGTDLVFWDARGQRTQIRLALAEQTAYEVSP
jgi:hypothetical protein